MRRVFSSYLLELVGVRRLLNPPTAFIFIPHHARSNQLSYIAQLIRQLKKVSIFLCLQ